MIPSKLNHEISIEEANEIIRNIIQKLNQSQRRYPFSEVHRVYVGFPQ